MAAGIMALFLAGFIFLILCLIGHVIWLGISSFYRSMFGPFCPSCNAPLDPNGYCTGCLEKGMASDSKPSLEKDLLALKRLLQHAESRRLLSDAQIGSLRNCLIALSVANKKPQGAPASTVVTPAVVTPAVALPLPADPAIANTVQPMKPARDRLDEVSTPGFTPVPTSPITSKSIPSQESQKPIAPAGANPILVPTVAAAVTAKNLPTPKLPEGTLLAPAATVIARETPAAREVHPLDAPDDPRDLAKPGKRGLPQVKESTKAFTAEMIWAFMEKSNIRWMELIGAALVVICSAGLVISLWHKLSDTNRFFPSAVFMLATLAVHGMGQYTLKKWKLRDTSRGILNIALMLIPMSVMTGILLSKKGGSLELGLQFYTVLTIGVLIYGTLAVTAAKSLFNSSWFPVAATTIISSLSLVPLYINCNTETGWNRIEFLLPALAMLAVSVWDLSVSAAYRHLRTEGYYRRQITMLAQILFASFSAVVFWWYMRPSTKPEFPGLFWALLGISGTALSVWGFVNGKLKLPGNLFGLAPAFLVSTDSGQDRYLKPGLSNASPMVVGSWVFGIVAILMSSYSLTRVFDDRTALITLLAGMALWLGSFSWIARSPLSSAIAGLLVVIVGTLSIERLGFGIQELSWAEWISFERVVSLGVAGAVVAAIATLAQPFLLAMEGHRKPFLSLGPYSWFDRWRGRLKDSEIASFMITSGVGSVLSAAILSFVATLVPAGRTPYGGTWAPLLVLAYGIASTIVGLLKIKSMPYLLPVAQGLTVFATIRLCEYAEHIPELIRILPEYQRSALGLTGVACAWASIYAIGSRCRPSWKVLSYTELSDLKGSKVFQSMGDSSSALAFLSCLVMWLAKDHCHEATMWGWCLPVTLALVWFAREKTWLREGCLGSIMLWGNGALHDAGHLQGWWENLDYFSIAGLHILLTTILLFAFERSLNAGRKTLPFSRWFQGDSEWAYDSCNAVLCVLLTLGIGLVSATLYLATWSLTDWATMDVRWISATDHGRTLQFAITITTLLVFSAWLTWYSSRYRTLGWIQFWGVVPALCAAMFCCIGASADHSVLISLIAMGVFGVAQAFVGGVLSNRLAKHQVIASGEPTEALPSSERFDSWLSRLQNIGFGKFITVSGYSTVMLGAILSLISMQSLWGNSELGASWLPVFVFLYAWGILFAGLIGIRTSQYFIPIGQLLGILATIKLCESTGWVPQWILDARPMQSSAIGVSLLACTWGILYAIASNVRIPRISRDRELYQAAPCFQFLGESSILVAVIGQAFFWLADKEEHLRLVTWMGWCVPLAFFLVWIARGRTYAREGAIAGLLLWGQGSLHHIGHTFGWWEGTGTFAIAMIHVIFACASLFAIDFISAQLRKKQSLAPWLQDNSEWAYGVTNTLLLSVLTLGIVSIGIPQLINGLVDTSDQPIGFFWHPTADLEVRNAFATGMLALGLFAAWLSRISPRMGWGDLSGTHGFVLCLAALLFSFIGSPAQGVIATLWAFGGLSMVAEAWYYFRGRSTAMEERRELLQSKSRTDGIPRLVWQDVLKAVSSIALLTITVVAIFLAWSGSISPDLQLAIRGDAWAAAETLPRIFSLAAWMAPAMLIVSWHWLLATIHRRDSLAIQWPGFIAAILLFLSWFFVLFNGNNTLFGQITLAVKTLCGAFALYSLATQLIPIALYFRKSTASADPDPRLSIRDEIGAKSIKDESLGFVEAGWNMAVMSACCLLALVFFAFTDNVFNAVAPTLTKDIVDISTLVVFTLSVTAVLFNGWLHRVGAGPMMMVAMAVAAPLVPQLDWVKDYLLRGWGTAKVANGALYNAEPLHAMLVLWLIALAVGLFRPANRREGAQITAFENGLCNVLAVIVGVLGMWQGSATNAWWTCAILFPLSVLILLSGLVRGWVGDGHLAAAIAGAGMLLVRTKPPFSNFNPFMVWDVLVGPLVMGLISLGWILVAQWRKSQTPEGKESYFKLPSSSGFTVDQTISLHLPIAMIFWSLLALVAQWVGYTIEKTEFTIAFVAVFGSLCLAFGRIWDWRSRKRGWSIYLNCLSVAFVIAIAINQAYRMKIDDSFLVWAISGLIAMTTMAVMLREWLRESNSLIPTLRLGSLAPRQEEFERARVWMVGFHTTIGFLILIPTVGMAFYHPEAFTRRLTSLFPWIISLSILPIATELRQKSPRVLALMLITFGAYLVGWSDFSLVLSEAGWWQNHFAYAYLQRAFVISIGIAWAYRYASQWLWEKLDWGTLLNRASIGTLCAGGALGVVTLGLERGFSSNSLPVHVGFTSLAAWLGLIFWTLQIALRPSPNQPEYSIPMRRLAFYVCEVSMFAFAITLHFHYPDLFGGILAKWWPIVVYAMAITSIGVGEWFHRQDHPVLRLPMFHNSLLLPLVPLVGVWLPNAAEYSIGWKNEYFYLLLLSTSIAYGAQGVLRGMTSLKALAGAFLLVSFWSALSVNEGLSFTSHPQLWIVPPAIAALIFVETNRKFLSTEACVATRYIAILLIYCSSTVEMMMKSFEEMNAAPLVLLGLALVGMVLGIALRVRAFLYCGSVFIFIALIGMVWNAQKAIGSVWPWWVFGIATGVFLIAILGYFEKNRSKFLSYAEKLRGWQP